MRKQHNSPSIKSLSRIKTAGSKDTPMSSSRPVASTSIPYRFGQMPVYPSGAATIQPKLYINAPGDAHEREAEQVAARIGRMHRAPGADRPLMRKAESGGGYEASPALTAQLRASKGGGAPLPEGTRRQMEGAFGRDFSQVRAHTDATAAEMSRGIQARAFTHGRDIFFNSGEYRPGAAAGRELLAHELAHVVQQDGAGHTSVIQRDGGEKKEEPKEKTEVEALVTHDFAKGKTSAKVSTTRTGQEELAPGVTATATEKTTEESISTSAELKVKDKSTGLSAAGGVKTESASDAQQAGAAKGFVKVGGEWKPFPSLHLGTNFAAEFQASKAPKFSLDGRVAIFPNGTLTPALAAKLVFDDKGPSAGLDAHLNWRIAERLSARVGMNVSVDSKGALSVGGGVGLALQF